MLSGARLSHAPIVADPSVRHSPTDAGWTADAGRLDIFAPRRRPWRAEFEAQKARVLNS